MTQTDSPNLQTVAVLLVTLQDRAAVARACIEKLDIDPAEVDEILDQARRQLTIAADYHRDEEVGRALLRLNDLYERSLRVQDVKTALATQKEIDRLLDLYSAAGARDEPPAGRPDGRILRTLAEVAKHYGRHQQTAKNWTSRGMPREPDGTYNLDDIDDWLAEEGLVKPEDCPA